MKPFLIIALMWAIQSFASGECLVSKAKEEPRRVDSGWYTRIGGAFCQVSKAENKTAVACTLNGEQIVLIGRAALLVSFASDKVIVDCVTISQQGDNYL